MKYIISCMLLLISFASVGYAYTPTNSDKALMDKVTQHISTLASTNTQKLENIANRISPLVGAYDTDTRNGFFLDWILKSILVHVDISGDTSDSDTYESDTTTSTTAYVADSCGHDIDPASVVYGYNEVIDQDGTVIQPQGRPIQEWYSLSRTSSYSSDQNTREYAQIFFYVAQIRDALMCDIDTISQDTRDQLTKILTLNNIKTTQNLEGNRKEQYYSSEGIFEHLQEWEDFHPMMKYLEEAELELKCLAFQDFSFTNPEGENHCEIHELEEGAGVVLP